MTLDQFVRAERLDMIMNELDEARNLLFVMQKQAIGSAHQPQEQENMRTVSSQKLDEISNKLDIAELVLDNIYGVRHPRTGI